VTDDPLALAHCASNAAAEETRTRRLQDRGAPIQSLCTQQDKKKLESLQCLHHDSAVTCAVVAHVAPAA
jgi:hypothetical protein